MGKAWRLLVSFITFFHIKHIKTVLLFRQSAIPRERTAEHEVQSVSKADEGAYVCKARNDAGEIEEVVQIIVLEDFDHGGGGRPDYGGLGDSPEYEDGGDGAGEGQADVLQVDDTSIAPLGGNAQLTCSVVGNFGPILKVGRMNCEQF